MTADVVPEQVVREQHAASRTGQLPGLTQLDRRVGQLGLQPRKRIGTLFGEPCRGPQVRTWPYPQVAAVLLLVAGQPDTGEQRERPWLAVRQRRAEAIDVRPARPVRPRRHRRGELSEIRVVR